MRFDDQLYERIRAGAQASAAVVAPLVYDLVQPETVVDVGCGEGWWGQAFADLGCPVVVGVERETPAVRAPSVRFYLYDVSEAAPDIGAFDLALCLEVAEHLPEPSANALVGTLCGLAPVVLFSAGVPGQRGAGHVNEQWPDYWVERFEAQGFDVSGGLRWHLWDDDRVEPWYRQNLLIAATETYWPTLMDRVRAWTRAADRAPVAHPVIFGWRAEEAGRA